MLSLSGNQEWKWVTNHIFVSLPNLTEFDEERSWIAQTNNLANRASGRLRTVGVLSCHRRCGTLNLLGSRQVGALEYGH